MARFLSRKQIAWRLAQDIADGSYVNLGIGMPELVADYIGNNKEIIFHSENGILGMGPSPTNANIDYDLINAGKKPVTLLTMEVTPATTRITRMTSKLARSS